MINSLSYLSINTLLTFFSVVEIVKKQRIDGHHHVKYHHVQVHWQGDQRRRPQQV